MTSESGESSVKSETSSKKNSYNRCFTKLKVTKCSYEWTIDISGELFESNYEFSSPVFYPTFHGSFSSFSMRLVPALYSFCALEFRSTYKDYTSPFRFKISIVNSRGELTNTTKFKRCLNNSYYYNNNNFWNFINVRELLYGATGLLSNGKLTILCELKGILGMESYATIWGPKLVTDFSNIRNNGVSDVTFVVGNLELRAHKTILAARSPVFAAMCKSHLNTVTVTDIHPDIFKAVLKYIYTGNIDNLNELAVALYAASDKYELDTLKNICTNYLLDNLTEKSVIETLILAELHSDEYLKNKIKRSYVKASVTTIMKSEDWKAMVSNHPHLIDEALQLRYFNY